MLLEIIFSIILCLKTSNSYNTKPVVITSDKFLRHKPTGYHPENPDRISSCLSLLMNMTDLCYLKKPSAELSQDNFVFARDIIRSTHDKAYMNKVFTMCQRNAPYLSPYDQDTYISSHTWDQCILAQSAWIDAVNIVLNDKTMAFAVTRPPGHHAEWNKGMGFCIFNFAVGAALYALDYLHLKRVAILDFDVHHGNGIQNLVSARSDIRYCSLHESDIFPLSGFSKDTGHYNNILNIPLPGGTKWNGIYKESFINKALPFLYDFKPDLLIVSAGYDSLSSDELSSMNFQTRDYYEMGLLIKQSFGTNVMFGLEGGYNLEELPLAIKATIESFTRSQQ